MDAGKPFRGKTHMVSMQFEHDLKDAIRTIPDYPKPGIMFRDITTLLGNARAFRRAVDELVQPWAGMKIDKVAGIAARRRARSSSCASWARRCSPPASSSICPTSAAPPSCASSTCRCARSSASKGTRAVQA